MLSLFLSFAKLLKKKDTSKKITYIKEIYKFHKILIYKKI